MHERTPRPAIRNAWMPASTHARRDHEEHPPDEWTEPSADGLRAHTSNGCRGDREA